MRKKQIVVDKTDLAILSHIQKNSRISLETMAKKLGVAKSTINYRLKKLEQNGVIEGYHACIDPEAIGQDFVAIILVDAQYGPRYHERIGKKIAVIPGVSAVYYVFGEHDFVVIIRARDREDYMRRLDYLIRMPEIERTYTHVAGKVLKEDRQLDLHEILP
jgi:DNA-binding Lrp family transcriptional regulator